MSLVGTLAEAIQIVNATTEQVAANQPFVYSSQVYSYVSTGNTATITYTPTKPPNGNIVLTVGGNYIISYTINCNTVGSSSVQAAFNNTVIPQGVAITQTRSGYQTNFYSRFGFSTTTGGTLTILNTGSAAVTATGPSSVFIKRLA